MHHCHLFVSERIEHLLTRDMGELALVCATPVHKFVLKAIEESIKSPLKYHHGCVIVNGGKIVSCQSNSIRTSWAGETRCSTHAEMAAILSVVPHVVHDANHRPMKISKIWGSDLYVVKTVICGNTVRMGNSRPCHHCLLMCKKFGVKRVFYSTETGAMFMEKIKNMDNSYVTPCYKKMMNKMQFVY